MQFDADGDGKVSKQEAPERMQEGFDALDTNKDGALDQDEIKAMRDKMRAKFRRRRTGWRAAGRIGEDCGRAKGSTCRINCRQSANRGKGIPESNN